MSKVTLSLVLLIASVQYISGAEPECYLSIETGPCRAYIPSFGYNGTSHKCESFVYGGCNGNGNRFGTKAACEAACGDADGADDDDVPDICYLPRDAGRCRNRIPSFYYNPQTQVCESFDYGGCDGNANRFSTIEECQTFCKQLPRGDSAVPY